MNDTFKDANSVLESAYATLQEAKNFYTKNCENMSPAMREAYAPIFAKIKDMNIEFGMELIELQSRIRPRAENE